MSPPLLVVVVTDVDRDRSVGRSPFVRPSIRPFVRPIVHPSVARDRAFARPSFSRAHNDFDDDVARVVARIRSTVFERRHATPIEHARLRRHQGTRRHARDGNESPFAIAKDDAMANDRDRSRSRSTRVFTRSSVNAIRCRRRAIARVGRSRP